MLDLDINTNLYRGSREQTVNLRGNSGWGRKKINQRACMHLCITRDTDMVVRAEVGRRDISNTFNNKDLKE